MIGPQGRACTEARFKDLCGPVLFGCEINGVTRTLKERPADLTTKERGIQTRTRFGILGLEFWIWDRIGRVNWPRLMLAVIE
jgi:hypothetical protein